MIDQRHMHQVCLVLFILGSMTLLESKGHSDTTTLVGPVGGAVTFQCISDLGSSLEWFYIQRPNKDGPEFINGFHIKGVQPNEHTNRTEVNQTLGTMTMWNLQPSDQGLYECYMGFQNTKTERTIKLIVIANSSVPNVMVTCGSALCLVNCSHNGGYPLEEVQWGTFPRLNESQWKVVSSSDEMDHVSQLFSVFRSVLVNCSSTMLLNISCTVGGSVSQEHTICGGPPSKPLSEIGKIVEEILEMDNPSICGIPDPALLKLKELQRRVDNAGAGPSDASSPVSSQDISLCTPDESSASQDTGFAQGVAIQDDIESLKRKNLKLQIKLLEIQNKYSALKQKIIKNTQ